MMCGQKNIKLFCVWLRSVSN